MAFRSLENKPVHVRSTNDNSVQISPYECVTVNGIARDLDHSVQKVITEHLDYQYSLLVILHIVQVPKSGRYAKIPIRLCNISAETMDSYIFKSAH